MLRAYAETPGRPAIADATWPAGANVARDAHTPVLLLFLHPHCPCSRATLGELARLLARVQAPLATFALFYRPADAEAGWERTDLWDSAAAIPGCTRHQRRTWRAGAGVRRLRLGPDAALRRRRVAALQRRHHGRAAGMRAITPGDTALASLLTGGRADTVRDAGLRLLSPRRGGRRSRAPRGARTARESHAVPHTPSRERRTLEIFSEQQQLIFKQTDRMFAVLMARAMAVRRRRRLLVVAEDLGRAGAARSILTSWPPCFSAGLISALPIAARGHVPGPADHALHDRRGADAARRRS